MKALLVACLILLSAPAFADETPLQGDATVGGKPLLNPLRPEVTISLADYQDTAAIDTGSDITSLDMDSLESLAIEGKAQLIAMDRAQIADGSILQAPLYRIGELTVGKCRVHPKGGFVVRAGVKALIGMDVLLMLAPWSLTEKSLVFRCPR